MSKRLVKSKGACQKCKLRRRKCDEVKPICSNCARQGFTCSWLKPVLVGGVNVLHPFVSAERASGEQLESSQELVAISSRGYSNTDRDDDRFMPSFDDPAMLHGSATSFIHGTLEKSAMQFLFEKGGTSIIRYPTQKYAGFANLNPWRLALAKLSSDPVQIHTYIAIASAQLSKSQAPYSPLAQRYYLQAVRCIRTGIDESQGRAPLPAICAIAAHLSMFEMILFTSPKDRLVHYIGFHRLIEARIQSDLDWDAFQTLFEFYIFGLTTGSLFHFTALVGNRGINYIDEMIKRINRHPRLLGKEIVGIPEELASAAYKLSFVLHKTGSRRGDDDAAAEVQAISQQVYKWEPPYHMIRPEAHGLLTVAKVYQLACMCLLRKARHEDCSSHHPDVVQIVHLASSLLSDDIFVERPFICLGWPCVVLGIFAIEPDDRNVLRRLMEALRVTAGLESYRSALEFLTHVWEKDLGHKALEDPVLLSTVQI